MKKFYRNKKGQVIGNLTLEDGKYRKVVKKSKHLMRKYDAWGIDYETWQDLRKEGCTEIRIKEEEEDKIYSIPFDVFSKMSIVENYGDGDQAFCSREHFSS